MVPGIVKLFPSTRDSSSCCDIVSDSFGRAESFAREGKYGCRDQVLNTSLAVVVCKCGTEKCGEGCDKMLVL